MSKAVLTEYTVRASVSHAVRVALVADLHERKADDILGLLRGSKPDLIAVAGDTFERSAVQKPYKKCDYNLLHRMVIAVVFNVNYALMVLTGRKHEHDTQYAREFLSKAAETAPVFLSLGNHESELCDDDLRFLSENGITLLDNADTEFYVNGELIRIGGLSTKADEGWLETFAKKDGFKLLLSHHPEYYDRLIADKPVDLVLSGHNHGGQVRLFGKPMFSAGGGLLPKYGRGLYHGRLAVSAGCSNTVAFPRLFNPRELVVIDVIPRQEND